MEIQLRTDKGRVRPVNEDAVLAFTKNEYEILLLADGLGGHRAGEVASRMVVEAMRERLSARDLDPMEEALREAAQYANAAVFSCQKNEPDYAGMGSTLVCAVIGPEEVHIAHAGDSRAYLASENGLTQLTKDHCVSNDLAGRSEEVSENLKHMLTRAMGTEQEIRIDYLKIEPGDGTLLLLCSDGLSNELSKDEILGILQSPRTLSERADLLIEQANANGGKDNITLALCERKGAEA